MISQWMSAEVDGEPSRPVHARDVLHGIQPKKEERRRIVRISGRPHRLPVLVQESHLHPNILDAHLIQPIVDPHMRIKRLPLQRQFLLDLDLHLGTNGIIRCKRGVQKAKETTATVLCMIRRGDLASPKISLLIMSHPQPAIMSSVCTEFSCLNPKFLNPSLAAWLLVSIPKPSWYT